MSECVLECFLFILVLSFLDRDTFSEWRYIYTSETSNRESLCASIKRLFIAFLISNFMAPVKVWLGVEYLKLAGRLGVAGIQQQDQNLSRSGKLFKALVVLCFCSAAMYIINMVVVYAWLY
nr:hypothetical protein [Candidatus Sigynarchaeum springense]